MEISKYPRDMVGYKNNPPNPKWPNGARLAVREHNKSKGLKEKAIELIICDDKAEISTAIKCANKFVKEKVVGVIGHLNSQISIETSKIYLNNNCISHLYLHQ